MLSLTRNVGEKVVIGDNEVEITIVGVRGKQVRLGFVAAKDKMIHRKEIYKRWKDDQDANKKEEAND